MKFRLKRHLLLSVLELCMILLSLLIIVPLLIMIFGSLKTAARAAQFSLDFPVEMLFSNYAYVIKKAKILRAALNSVIITFCAVLICIFCSALVSFLTARKRSAFTKFLNTYFLAGVVAPMQIITTFGLLHVLHLNGSYVGVILVFSALQMSWGVFMFTGFIETVPRELDEAAFIDGYPPLRVFFSIILPLLKPITVTTVVMISIFIWNNFQIPLYFFNTSKSWTLPLTVYNFFGRYFNYWNYVFANLVLVALPVTILYLFGQKYVIDGMTAGAVKG